MLGQSACEEFPRPHNGEVPRISANGHDCWLRNTAIDTEANAEALLYIFYLLYDIFIFSGIWEAYVCVYGYEIGPLNDPGLVVRSKSAV